MGGVAETVGYILLAGAAAGVVYAVAAACEMRRFVAARSLLESARGESRRGEWPPVSVLKPVSGDEPGLYENLSSFCEQDYPEYEILFAARDRGDSAVPVVRRLMREQAGRGLVLVVSGRPRGINFKVENLIELASAASHDLFVVSDSDMRVARDYLKRVVAPLLDDPERVGLVTCLYVGRATAGVCSRLGAMGINYGFLPAVLVGWLLGVRDTCFGATVVIRRDVLDRLGGFAALRNQLADDYALGAAVCAIGRRIELCSYLVDDIVWEPDWKGLLLHELRWARTIRAVAPWGFAASVITNPVGLAAAGTVMVGPESAALAVLAASAAARVLMVRVMERSLRLERAPAWLVGLRDLLSIGVWLASFCGRRVTWRGQAFQIGRDGHLITE